MREGGMRGMTPPNQEHLDSFLGFRHAVEHDVRARNGAGSSLSCPRKRYMCHVAGGRIETISEMNGCKVAGWVGGRTALRLIL